MSSNSSRISSHVFRPTKVARLGHAVPSSATRCQDPPLPMLHAAMKPAASALFSEACFVPSGAVHIFQCLPVLALPALYILVWMVHP